MAKSSEEFSDKISFSQINSSTLIDLSACAIGWKLFILNALYNKFPRFKAKYDSVSNFFRSLPTHNELEINRLSEERTEVSQI